MTIAELLLQSFDIEMKGTRATLERIPEDKVEYKPHEKSMAMGRLAAHVARLPQFMITIFKTASLDLATVKWPPLIFESRTKVLAEFDALVAEARKLLVGATQEQLEEHWKMSWGEKTIADESRALLYHTMFLNHLIHHRAQLGVYLRLNHLPVPPLYGPTADDSMGF
jgi:uncharacterized damage-inducible protein DinB